MPRKVLSIYQLFRRASIGVIVVVMAAMMGAGILFSMHLQRSNAERELTIEGAMIAGLMLQGDQINLEPVLLKQWKLNPAFRLACVVDGNNHLAAAVGGINVLEASEAQRLCSDLLSDESNYSRLAPIKVQITIDHESKRLLARIVLLGDVVFSWDSIALLLLCIALPFVVLIGALYFTGRQMRRRIQMPLRHIATSAQRVSLHKDYALRISGALISEVPSEIGDMMNAMNAMLDEIEDRDTRLTRKTTELEKAKQAAEAANLAKSCFLSNVSHELRTPLNAIIGFSSMMTQSRFGPLGDSKYAEYARDIHDSGTHLLEVINDILDLSNAESGKMRANFDMFALPKVIEKALNIIEGLALEKKIDIYTDIPAKLPKIVADPVRIVQILLNILSNALKYTPEGGKVTIRVSAEQGQNNVHFFEIEVEDTGVGMTADEINNAFVSFNQADAGLNRKYDGAGLGLPITKHLVELHHGRIKIISNKGLGTTVNIRLPSNPALLD